MPFYAELDAPSALRAAHMLLILIVYIMKANFFYRDTYQLIFHAHQC